MYFCSLDKTKFKKEEEMLVYTFEKMVTPRLKSNVEKFRLFLDEICPSD